MGQDNVGRECNQFCRMSTNGGYIGGSPTGIDPHVAADDPTQLPELLKECSDKSLVIQIIGARGEKYPDTPHPLALLRMRCKRPCRRASYQRDEIASPHVRPKSKATAS